MRNFSSNNRPRDRRSSSGRRFGGRNSRHSQMYDAVCDDCGKDCRVPFKPSGDKPVYCSECFEKRDGRSAGRSNQGSGRGRDFSNRSPGENLRNSVSDRTASRLVEEIAVLNSRLETIINLLLSADQEQSEPKAKRKKESKKAGKEEVNPVIEVSEPDKEKVEQG